MHFRAYAYDSVYAVKNVDVNVNVAANENDSVCVNVCVNVIAYDNVNVYVCVNVYKKCLCK